MNYYITRLNGYILWQKGHYMYEIEGRGVKRLVIGPYEQAISILNTEYAN